MTTNQQYMNRAGGGGGGGNSGGTGGGGSSGGGNNGRGGMGGGGNPGSGAAPATKHQRNSTNTPEGHPKDNFWWENKLFDQALKATKQKIKQQHGCTYLSHLLKTGGTSIPEALNNWG